MIHARFHHPFADEEDWTVASFEGTREDDAFNILATRLTALEYDIWTWDGEEWNELGEEEA